MTHLLNCHDGRCKLQYRNIIVYISLLAFLSFAHHLLQAMFFYCYTILTSIQKKEAAVMLRLLPFLCV
jgi:hypothetical protein